MLKSLRRVSVLALAGFLVLGCGRERLTTSQVPEGGVGVRRAPGKLALDANTTPASVIVRVRQGQAPLSGVTVHFARSVSGRAADYAWSGKTGARGRARVEIAGSGVSGYYSVRATQEGISLGSWTSIPINAGYESTVELPVGAKARVTGSLMFVSERSPKRPNSFRFQFADYRQNGGTWHV